MGLGGREVRGGGFGVRELRLLLGYFCGGLEGLEDRGGLMLRFEIFKVLF